MSKFTKMLSFVLALVMVFSLAACGKSEGDTTGTTNPSGSNPGGSADGKKDYTVTVKTNGGMAMEGIDVYVYADEALSDMKAAGSTDAKGVATFKLAEGQYYVQLQQQKIPNGYDLQPSYAFVGNSANITLTSNLVDGDIEGHVFQIGDVMYDFTFSDQSKIICACGTVNDTSDTIINIADDGSEVPSYVTRTECVDCGAALNWNNPEFPSITLSDVLAEKELVVLNFWYTTCSNCVVEFPILNEAYNTLSDDVAVFGLNSYAPDTVSGVMTFESSFGLPLDFPLGKVSNNFNPGNLIIPSTGSASRGYPTTVFIDRYGVICAIEEGSMTSLTQWISIMSHFLGDDYDQKLVPDLNELIERIIPTNPFPSDEEIADAIQVGDFTVDYHGEEGDIYSWPFIVTEKDGRVCLKASNQKIYESYAIMYAEFELKKGDVVGFDYLASCEVGGDYLHVIVDGEAIYSIADLSREWKSAYCWVAPKDGTYEVAFCYIKDTDVDKGDDTVYIDNLRVVTVDDIDTATYIPSQAAVEQADGSFEYATIYFNENDGYYHVGSVDGPLLLANIMGYTQLVPDNFLYMLGLEGELVLNGHDYLADLTPFATVASNSSLNGYCTVTYELAEILKVVAEIHGFDGHEDEWLKVCKYYAAYGTNGKQLADPSAGLAAWSAYVAVEGNGYVDENGEGQNFFYYDGHPILPRGYWARFTPEKSGVYRITSHTDYTEGLDAWIFNEHGQIIYEANGGEMMGGDYADPYNITMVMYMEAGRDYFIDIALYDIYGVGTVLFDITYLGNSYELFTACAMPPFTWDEVTGETILPHIDAAINPADGLYHEVLQRDANGNPIRFGSIIYAYFTGPTAFYEQSIVQMINMGGFDFGMTDLDLEIVAYLNMHDGDIEATDAYLHTLWGDSYAEYAEIYMIEDVFAGIYHGRGGDLREEILSYVDKIIQNSADEELNGCVPVDAKLQALLQMLMDKYTFEGVEGSWQGLCFYYKQLRARP